MKDRPRILVVDDHVEMVDLLCDELRDEGWDVVPANSVREALARLEARTVDIVLTDLRMRGADGFDLLDFMRTDHATVPVIIMTAFGAVESAVEAMKRGAYHYLSKPFATEELMLLLARALESRRLRTENARLRAVVAEQGALEQIVGSSAAITSLRERIARVALVDAPVLIRGESGTGKELVARALHACGPRSHRPFVAVNCAAIPRELLESELFGHVQGAFTGAAGARRGLLAEANGGTLFLDEIGDMPIELQAKLLRVLQSGELRAVGADATQTVDVRVIAATHQPLEQRVADGGFREDLLYRLDVLPIRVPPLADRRDDIPLLVEHIVARLRVRYPIYADQTLPRETVAALARRSWPGNVRELENVVQRLFLLGDEDQPEPASTFEVELDEMPPLRVIEQRYIEWVLGKCQQNKTRAAEVLGVDPSTLHRRLK